MRPTRPLSLALKRLSLGASFAKISEIFKSSVLAINSFSAFEAADLTVFATLAAAGEGINLKVVRASSTYIPLTRFTIGLSFFTDIPVLLDFALIPTIFSYIVPNKILNTNRKDVQSWKSGHGMS